MERAMRIIEGMIADVDRQLCDYEDKYRKTDPTNIYDDAYRRILVEGKDRLIRERIVLCNIKDRLAKGENNEDN